MIRSLIHKFGLAGLVLLASVTQGQTKKEVLSETQSPNTLFAKQAFTQSDAILVVEKDSGIVYDWRSSQPLVPASLTKLATAYTAINKWSIDHAFDTDFYQFGNQLWVKGYGDPYLVSEELELLVQQLQKLNLDCIESLHIDNSYFANELVPGRSAVNDPYNAPLSAVAANFNTVMVGKRGGAVISAEPQTPMTLTAEKIATHPKYGLPNTQTVKAQRFNLRNGYNAQMHFAQLLVKKLAKPQWSIVVDEKVPENAKHLYRYTNSHSLKQIIRGMLEYSNNFMANQLFLNLGGNSEHDPVTFSQAASYTEQTLSQIFNWQGHRLVEGSGLSRSNRLSAQQIDDLLIVLKPHKTLFKQSQHPAAQIYAKTGTLKGVRSFAGYIGLGQKEYRFVFIFNRQVGWRYREQLLVTLVDQLTQQQAIDKR